MQPCHRTKTSGQPGPRHTSLDQSREFGHPVFVIADCARHPDLRDADSAHHAHLERLTWIEFDFASIESELEGLRVR